MKISHSAVVVILMVLVALAAGAQTSPSFGPNYQNLVGLSPTTISPSFGPHYQGVSAGPNYDAPCNDISTGCAAAISVTRDMTGSATNAFRMYNGSSTLDVGFTNHVVNLSGIAAFCAGVEDCKMVPYEQISGSLIPAVTGPPVNGHAPSQCISGQNCAADYFLDPETGLPILITTFPSEYDLLDTNITGGSAASSVWSYGRNEGAPGEFGIGHTPTQSPLINGTDFLNLLYYGPSFDLMGYIRCAAANNFCFASDEETSVEPFTSSCTGGTCPPNGIGATYSATGVQGDTFSLLTYAGSNGAVKGYTNNATPLWSEAQPSSVSYNSSSLSPGQHLKIGCGGDCTQSNIIIREGIVANGQMSAADYTALQTNASNFYAAHTTPAACHGGADLDYYFLASGDRPSSFETYYPPGSGLLAYALAQVRASYFGPLATLKRASDNTSQTFSSALAAGSVGCGLDPAAATFCNATTCTVTKLFNQGTFATTTPKLGNAHDTALDATCTSVGVTFNSLNGLPTMNFAGVAFCTVTPSNPSTAYVGLAAVARRTGNTGAFQSVIDTGLGGSTEQQVGFNNSANNVFYFATTGAVTTQAATDNHWHDMYMENAAGAHESPFTDNSAASTVASTVTGLTTSPTTFGGKSASSQNLTGDIAEIDVISVTSAASANYSSHANVMFSAHEGIWGTLPN